VSAKRLKRKVRKSSDVIDVIARKLYYYIVGLISASSAQTKLKSRGE
jgi:hypothetical protein